MKRRVKLISVFLVTAILFGCITPIIPIARELNVTDSGRLPFEDVIPSHWFYDSVIFCYVNGSVKGMNDYSFAPNSSLTRAQFVTMLSGISGDDISEYTVDTFSDVKPSHWYYNAVGWAYEKGIVSGTSPQHFSPNQPITRQTLARIMWLFMKDSYPIDPAEGVLDGYKDASAISDWALEGIQYTVAQGVMSGVSADTLSPHTYVTRGQAARIISVYMREYLCGSCEHQFTDADCTESKKCGLCCIKEGLPNGHRTDGAFNCMNGGFCKVCGKYASCSKIVHGFRGATCGSPRTCTICGLTRGEPTGKHSFSAPTCTKAATCRCGAVNTPALGHSTKFGICVRCNAEVFPSEYMRLGYYMTTKAVPDGKGRYTALLYEEDINGEVEYTSIRYDANKAIFAFESIEYDAWEKRTKHLVIYTDRVSDRYTFEFTVYDKSNAVIGRVSGYFKTADFQSNYAPFTVTSSSGSIRFVTDYAAYDIAECICLCDSIFDMLCGGSMDTFGFKIDRK